MTPTLTAAACDEHQAARSRQLASDPVSVLLANDPALRNHYSAFEKGIASGPTSVGIARHWGGRWQPYFAAHRLACLANGLDTANTPLLTAGDMEGLKIPSAPPDERAWEANWLALPCEPRLVATIRAILENNLEVGVRLEIARDAELKRLWWGCPAAGGAMPFDPRPHLVNHFKRRSEAEYAALSRVLARLYRGKHPFAGAAPDDAFAVEILSKLAGMIGFDKRGAEIEPPTAREAMEAA